MSRRTEPPQSNPWAPVSAAPPSRRRVADDGPSYVRLGPSRPQGNGSAAPTQGGLPLWTADPRARAPWWWIGCHGGAGATTLHHEVPGGVDSGIRAWPVRPDGDPVNVVLVARTHARGLTAAQQVARQWAEGHGGGAVLLGLVAVADGPGRLPRSLSDALRFVAGGVPRMWRIPWVEDWRIASALGGPSIRATSQLAADLARLLSERQER